MNQTATTEQRAQYANCRAAARSALRPYTITFTNRDFNDACRRSRPLSPAEWCTAADAIAENVAAAVGDELPRGVLMDRVYRIINISG